ncbi:hypothetical protein, partial [Microcystis aeruginosa]|uniref:hypothetical protein n=1 Tax=Microcystis aeruginosa TaxID=1126 RepID=UPI001F2E58B2
NPFYSTGYGFLSTGKSRYLVWLRSAFGVRVLKLISGLLRLGFFSLSVCRCGIVPSLFRQDALLIFTVG